MDDKITIKSYLGSNEIAYFLLSNEDKIDNLKYKEGLNEIAMSSEEGSGKDKISVKKGIEEIFKKLCDMAVGGHSYFIGYNYRVEDADKIENKFFILRKESKNNADNYKLSVLASMIFSEHN